MSIKIKPSKRGTFTSYCGGQVTQECINKAKNSPNKGIRKKAVFAENARKWNKKRFGGILKGENGLDANTIMLGVLGISSLIGGLAQSNTGKKLLEAYRKKDKLYRKAEYQNNLNNNFEAELNSIKNTPLEDGVHYSDIAGRHTAWQNAINKTTISQEDPAIYLMEQQLELQKWDNLSKNLNDITNLGVNIVGNYLLNKKKNTFKVDSGSKDYILSKATGNNSTSWENRLGLIYDNFTKGESA